MDRDDWSFELRYYSSLPQSEKWIDLNGQVITDPFEGGAARDVNGNIIRWSDTFVLMSQNNPYWFDYQNKSAQYALKNGLDAINVDSMIINPITLYGGDFSLWCIHEFRSYLKNKFSPSELEDMGIDNIDSFDVKEYIKAYPPYINPDDVVIKEYLKFGFKTSIAFFGKLRDEVHQYGEKKGKFVPFYGNLHIGHPSFPSMLFNGNQSVLLGRSVDIIQLETIPPTPPKERAMTTYKIGWAMGDYEKPVWSLHQPFYGYDFEPPLDLNKSFEGLNKIYLAEAYAAGAIPEIDLGGWPGIPDGAGLFVQNGNVVEGLAKYTDFVSRYQGYFKNVRPKNDIALHCCPK
jgi:hypothetical protein